MKKPREYRKRGKRGGCDRKINIEKERRKKKERDREEKGKNER
mgnify:FL=1